MNHLPCEALDTYDGEVIDDFVADLSKSGTLLS
jgi:hypothetical protein